MNTHEFQAKQILQKYGIPIPPYKVISELGEFDAAIAELGIEQAVLKVQVHAGGRGKAGGVKIGKRLDEVRKHAQSLLGMKIVNNQTGAEGVIAHQILITPLTEIAKEYYMGAVIDRQNAQAVLMASPDGGVDIEEVAEKTPERILKLPMSLQGTFRSYQLIELAKFMGWRGLIAKQGIEIAKGLAKAFMESDASLLEINPLVENNQGALTALDAKLSVDENALYRQSEISGFYDPGQIPENEVMAHEHNLAYVALEGEVGCMVNGAGLAMATMDMIYHFGGKPANFLDVGGGASKEKVAEGFKIILTDPHVKAILVNIFGGIMNCATLALGIVAAVEELKLAVPLIVRMEGTNVEEGRKILAESGLNIDIASSMTEAAEKVVLAAKGA